MSLDRAATLRQAEKLLRQGKLDQAIAEYLRLVEDQPRDWNTANLLGDLFMRAGQPEHAVEQFSRIAESLRQEGFLSKASALYKKILKLRPDDDHALMQAGELAAQQGLLADARSFFTSAASGRRHHGDSRGALDVAVRLGTLDPTDVEARLGAARARLELGDAPAALHDLHDLAEMLVEAGRDGDAIVPLREIARLDPGSAVVGKELVRILIAEGRAAEAAEYLTPEAVSADPALMRIAAEMRLRRGDLDVAFEMIDQLLLEDAAATRSLSELAIALASEKTDTAYMVADRVVGACVSRGDWVGAAHTLRQFVARAPHYLPALARLVDVCVDGGLQDVVFEAQGLLADAYLASGAAAEAKYVAEDLVTRQPWNREHFSRMRSALAAEGDADPDRSLADWLAESPGFGADDEQLPSEVADALPSPRVSSAPEARAASPTSVSDSPATATSRNPHAIDLDLIFGRQTSALVEALPTSLPRPAPASTRALDQDEEDLSIELDAIRPPEPPVPTVTPTDDIESVFAQLRDEAAHRPVDESAEVAYTRGAAMYEAGQLQEAEEQLRGATRSPRRRFAAASLLARIYQDQHRTADAIDWLGHAVDAPGLTPLERFDTLHRLAELLETSGEAASALAVCLELQADAGDYRDLTTRIARLSRAQAGG